MSTSFLKNDNLTEKKKNKPSRALTFTYNSSSKRKV